MRAHISYLTHTSTVLADNPLGDPAERTFPVYLPPGYSDGDERYPVIWVLAPFGSWGERYLNLKAWNDNLIQRAHRVITNGEAPPAILALPDCFTSLGGSQYLNSSAVGRYQDYVIKELVPFVDTELRTLPERAHRGVMGYSSGGYGALVLSMLYPEVFSAAASHAGDMGFEHAFPQDFGKAVRQLATYDDGLSEFIAAIGGPDMSSSDFFPTLNLVAMSACYSPNPEAEAGIELPFDTYTGKRKPEVWARWKALDPVTLAETHLEALAGLNLLYFDCGVYDEYNLFLGARQLHRTLEEHDVPHTYEEFEGGHRNINYRYDVSLPLMLEAVAP
jgi:enterochelin esterase family protein